MLWQKDAPGANVVIRGARVLDPAQGIDATLEVRIDERGREQETGPVDDAMPVPLE